MSNIWNQLGLDIDGEAAGDQSGWSVSMNADGTIVAIGAPLNDGNGTDSGQVRVYENISGTWTKLGNDIDGDAIDDQSGYSVSMNADGTIVAIGAPLNNGNGTDSGQVRVYSWTGTAWVQLGGNIDGEAANDQSGYSVSMNDAGTIVAIGAIYNDDNGSGTVSGHVRVYENISGTWTQLGGDIDGDAALDESGHSVSINAAGTIVAIGAPGNIANPTIEGYVRVYERDESNTTIAPIGWSKIGDDIIGEATGDRSGHSVSMNADGDRVAIGAPSNLALLLRGHVRVYERDESNTTIVPYGWTQLGGDIDGEDLYDQSGRAVSMNAVGDRVAIGAPYNDDNNNNTGHVRVYERDESNTTIAPIGWTQLGIDIIGEATGDNSGWSVSMNADGDRVAIGAPLNDDGGLSSGHVRVFSSPLSATITVTSPILCFGEKATLECNASGGTDPYSFNWQVNIAGTWTNPPVTGQQVEVPAGLWRCTVTDDVSATFTTTGLTVDQPTAIAISLTAINVTCNEGNDGEITSAVSGGTPWVYGYEYSWNTSPPLYTPNISGLVSGTYKVTVEDSVGCTVMDSTFLYEPNAITVTIQQTNVSCNGASDGTITASSPAGGTSPYTYEWSNGQTGSSITGLGAGVYSLAVTDNAGCIFTSPDITITEPDQLTVTTEQTNVSCYGGNDGSAEATASGGVQPYDYYWNTGQNTPNIDELTAGTYTVFVTDSCTFMDSVTIEITEPDQLVVSLTATNITCFGADDGAITSDVSGGEPTYNYSWNNGLYTSQNISGLAQGYYTLTVSDSVGCTYIADSVGITEPTELFASASSTNVSCNGGSDGTINTTMWGGSAPINYSWNPSTPGNNVNCVDMHTIHGDDSIVCTYTGVAAGMYQLNVIDNNLCTFTPPDITISEPPAINVSLSTTDPTCNGGNDGTANTTVSGGTPWVDGYEYSWDTGQTTQNISGLVAGSYKVTVEDSLACTVMDSVFLNEPTAITVTTQQTNVSCFGGSDGTIMVLTTGGGTPPYTYVWSNGQTGPFILGLTSGTYSLIVTDNNLCTFTPPDITITEPSELISNATIVNPTFRGGSTGSIQPNITGGTPPYTYLWSTGATENTITGLSAGLYYLEVTDTNGCNKNFSYTVEDGNPSCPTCLPNMGRVMIMSNNRYYKPHSLGTEIGQRCNRALIRARKRRT